MVARSAMKLSSDLSWRYREEQRSENAAGFSPTRSFVSWSRLGTTVSFRMAQCSLTICLATAVPPESRNSGDSTKLGNHVSVGTNATILPVTICDQVVIGAGAVVTKDIAEPGIYAGNPARLLRRL